MLTQSDHAVEEDRNAVARLPGLEKRAHHRPALRLKLQRFAELDVERRENLQNPSA